MLCLIIRITLVLLLACYVPLKAQDQRDNGFIGIGLGSSFILGKNIEAGTGLNLTVLNVGYVWEKGFGLTGVWAGGAHVFDSETTIYTQGTTFTLPAQAELSYGVLMIGPMYTLNLTDAVSLDFKARAGSLYTREKFTSDVSASKNEKFTLSASLGVGYRLKLANRWCLMLSSDYYAGRKQYGFAAGRNTHILSFTSGVGFVF